MAKNTHSQEILTGTSDSYTVEEASDPNPPVVIQRAMLGDVDKEEKAGDEELVATVEGGTDSSALSESGQKSSGLQSPSRRKPAPTTESLSEAPEKGISSTAPLTDGNGQVAELPPSDEDDEIPPYEDWTAEELRDECRTRNLIVGGTKPELIKRLEANDEENDLED